MIMTFAVLKSISEPFNAGKTTEVKLCFDPMHAIEGEIYIRVPSSSAGKYAVGETYSVFIQKMAPSDY